MLAIWVVLSMLAILSHTSETDRALKEGEGVEFIKKQKDALLRKILESIQTRNSASRVQSKKILQVCEFETEVSR